MRDLNEDLFDAARTGDAAGVSLLLAAGADPMDAASASLARAAENGHTECVRLLIPVSDPKAAYSRALCLAARYGHTECVKLLIPVSDPRADNSISLSWAAENGYAECVKILIPVSNPKDDNSTALRRAAVRCHVECVKLLAGPGGFGFVVNEIIEKMTSDDDFYGDDFGDDFGDDGFDRFRELQAAREEAAALQSSTPEVPASTKKSGRL